MEPAFAAEAGLLALHWLVEGYGYEITSEDVRAAFDATVTAADALGRRDDVEERIRDLIASSPEDPVAQLLRRALQSP